LLPIAAMQPIAAGALVGAIAILAASACSSNPEIDGASIMQDAGNAPRDADAPLPDASAQDARDDMSATGLSDGGAPYDAGSEPDSGIVADGGNTQDTGCAPPVSPVVETDPDGPGYDCMTAGCHRPGGTVQGGLTITVSGTLYDGKGKPLPGATIYVTDSTGKLLTLTSDNNANFWSGTSDGTVMPAGAYGTCLTYVKCYPPSQFEGSCQCATAAAVGALEAASVSMCPNGTQACTALGAGATNGECFGCHGTSGSPPAVALP